MYSDINGIDGIPNWNLKSSGCGPTAIASVLSSIGYKIDPIETAKLILLNEEGNLLDFYNSKETGRLGINPLAFIYLLQEIKRKKEFEVDYELLKCSYQKPNKDKESILEMISTDYMAFVLVGPRENSKCPKTFSNNGHYIAITSVNRENKEFYISNSNRTGDSQIDTTFSFEEILANMYTNTFDFLMIKRLKK